MKEIPLESTNILFKIEDESGNLISFHLDRLSPYPHRYISYILFNDTRFQLARYSTQKEALMYVEWIKSQHKQNKVKNDQHAI